MKRLVALIICGAFLGVAPTSADVDNTSARSVDAPRSEGVSDASLPSTGETCDGTQCLDVLILKTLAEHKVPGAALAVSVDGQLVYSRGFGYADLESSVRVEPDSRFRIASLAKPMTAAAILMLCEEGRLGLDDQVLTILDQLDPGDSAEMDHRWKDITVRQLLQHRAGWDRAMSGDPMFDSRAVAEAMGTDVPVSHDVTIRYMLGRPLDFEPGERYCYSNFGYCLLGRVIEHVTGRQYEEFVRTEILKPVGVTNMLVGHSLREFCGRDEVCYYDSGTGPSIFAPDRPLVPQPYGAWDLKAMDSHGGWVGSAVDLVRFAHCYYGAGRGTRLSAKSMERTVARPSKVTEADRGRPVEYYGLGWQVFLNSEGQLSQLSHRGSLPGCCSLLVCRGDGICYALLLNSRETSRGDNILGFVEDNVRQAIEQVESWPIAVDVRCQ